MFPVLKPKEMYNLDEHLINVVGISEEKLMEGAALSCKAYIDGIIPKNSSVLVVCGTGNNGGDGLALARHLNNEHDINFAIVGDKAKLNNSANINYNILTNLEVNEVDLDIIIFDDYDVIIDSILGIGSNGYLNEKLCKLMQKINSTDSIRIAIDLPTGINPENGIVENGKCFKSDYTITMYSYKTGMLLNDGKDYCGKIFVADLGINSKLIQSQSTYKLFTNRVLLKKSNNSSKFDYGKVLIIAGSNEMPGAACLTANSAISSGAGLVYLFTPKKDINLYSEVICIEEKSFDNIFNGNYDYINKVDSVVIGPGLGKNTKSEELVYKVIEKYTHTSLIIDADALNYIDINKTYSHNITLTPHIVEFARIIGVDTKTILKDIPSYVRETAKRMNLNILLKGPTTVISNGEDVVFVTNGIPEMATAGSGDVLSGILGAYINYNVFDKKSENIANAAFIHNESAQIALESKNNLIASDIYKAIQCIK